MTTKREGERYKTEYTRRNGKIRKEQIESNGREIKG